ncbi:MAG: hypothetical protein FWE97_02720 [Dehalococcoidia bacterium]|nr:hypothetical protein [Dehalococcoidia bacterium]
MKELKKAFRICYTIQAWLVLLFVLVLVLSKVVFSRGNIIVPDNLFVIMPVIHFVIGGIFLVITRIRLVKELVKLDPNEQDKVFYLYVSFNEIARIFNSNSENVITDKLVRTFYTNFALLMLLLLLCILVETVIGHVLLSAANSFRFP